MWQRGLAVAALLAVLGGASLPSGARAGVTRMVTRPPPDEPLPLDHEAFSRARRLRDGASCGPAECSRTLRDVSKHHTPAPNTHHTGPEQVHLALGAGGTIEVSWVDPRTFDKVDLSGQQGCVRWGTDSGSYTERHCTSPSYYATPDYQSGLFYHNSVACGDLAPGTTVYYIVGSDDADWSDEFSFVTQPAPGAFPYRLGLVGDLGQTKNSLHTLEHLDANSPQSVMLVGDLSYADTDQQRWDSYAQLVQPYATSRPWMVTEGNHEMELIKESMPFLAYETRYWVPHKASRSPSKLFYSYEVGPVHAIMLGSYDAFTHQSPQHMWLTSDLASIDRTVTPWVVVGLHAPWYNSNEAHQNEFSSFGMKDSFEQILYDHGVDVVFSGHVHAYERIERVLQGKGDACGPAFVNIGDGGNREGLAVEYMEPQPDWSAVREPSYGHGVLDFVNATHAHWQWHRNQDGEAFTADEVWLVKDQSCSSFFSSGSDIHNHPRFSKISASVVLSQETVDGAWGVVYKDGEYRVYGTPHHPLTWSVADERLAELGVGPAVPKPKKGKDEGKDEGKDQGKDEGKDEGKDQGKDEGKDQGKDEGKGKDGLAKDLHSCADGRAVPPLQTPKLRGVVGMARDGRLRVGGVRGAGAGVTGGVRAEGRAKQTGRPWMPA